MKTSLDSVLVRAGVFQRVKQRDKGEVGAVFLLGVQSLGFLMIWNCFRKKRSSDWIWRNFICFGVIYNITVYNCIPIFAGFIHIVLPIHNFNGLPKIAITILGGRRTGKLSKERSLEPRVLYGEGSKPLVAISLPYDWGNKHPAIHDWSLL